jgi:hypothetical protein
VLKKVMVITAAAAIGGAVLAPMANAADSQLVVSHIVAGGTSVGEVVNGSLTLAFNCTASATGDVVSMSITNCYITTGGPNEKLALPGTTASVAGTASVPLAPYQLCYSAVATYLDSSTRPISSCNSLVPTVIPGLPQLGLAVN